MTLEGYNNAIKNLTPPKDLSGGELLRWWSEQKKQLQNQLDEKDLEVVKSRQKKWQDKVQSSFD